MKFLAGFALFILLLSATTAHSKGNKKNIPCKNWVSVKFTKDGKKYQVDVPKLLLEKDGFCARPFKRKQEKDKG